MGSFFFCPGIVDLLKKFQSMGFYELLQEFRDETNYGNKQAFSTMPTYSAANPTLFLDCVEYRVIQRALKRYNEDRPQRLVVEVANRVDGRYFLDDIIDGWDPLVGYFIQDIQLSISATATQDDFLPREDWRMNKDPMTGKYLLRFPWQGGPGNPFAIHYNAPHVFSALPTTDGLSDGTSTISEADEELLLQKCLSLSHSIMATYYTRKQMLNEGLSDSVNNGAVASGYKRRASESEANYKTLLARREADGTRGMAMVSFPMEYQNGGEYVINHRRFFTR